MVGDPNGGLIGIRTSIHFRRPKVELPLALGYPDLPVLAQFVAQQQKCLSHR